MKWSSLQTKHTPGPYLVEPVDAATTNDPDLRLPDSVQFWIVGREEVLALVEKTICDEARANANLFGAAPDLLDACALFTAAAHEVVALLNAQGIACPSSIALAAELARNAVEKAQGGR